MGRIWTNDSSEEDTFPSIYMTNSETQISTFNLVNVIYSIFVYNIPTLDITNGKRKNKVRIQIHVKAYIEINGNETSKDNFRSARRITTKQEVLEITNYDNARSVRNHELRQSKKG